jgi:hypothetical protein
VRYVYFLGVAEKQDPTATDKAPTCFEVELEVEVEVEATQLPTWIATPDATQLPCLLRCLDNKVNICICFSIIFLISHNHFSRCFIMINLSFADLMAVFKNGMD